MRRGDIPISCVRHRIPHLKQFAQYGEQIYSSWNMAKKFSNCFMEQIEIHKRYQMGIKCSIRSNFYTAFLYYMPISGHPTSWHDKSKNAFQSIKTRFLSLGHVRSNQNKKTFLTPQ